MCVLLYVPGLLVVLFKRRGLASTLAHVLALAATQAVLGTPFLLVHPRTYLKYAFEFSRVFLFKWTVNWRFLGEERFLSPAWARGLLAAHVATLALFGLFRWCRSDGASAEKAMTFRRCARRRRLRCRCRWPERLREAREMSCVVSPAKATKQSV